MSKNIKDKMLFNYSLLGKITDRGKSITDAPTNDEAMEITKNTGGQILFSGNEIYICSLSLLKNSLSREDSLSMNFFLEHDSYLIKIATLKANRTSVSVTRARHYKFVEK